jgi:hypothetical protein
VLRRRADEHRPENTLRNTRPETAAVVPASVPPPPDLENTQAQEPVQQTAARPAGRRSRWRGVPVMVGLLVLLLAGAGVALALRGLSGNGQASPSASSGAGETHDDKRTQKAGNGSGSGSDQGATAQQGSDSPETRKEQLVRDYYAAAPGGTDEAWAMLSPTMQGMGRERYDDFWRTIQAVDVQSAEASPGSDSVQVTLVYHSTDGRTSTERKVESLVDSGDGSYLIDSDEPAG